MNLDYRADTIMDFIRNLIFKKLLIFYLLAIFSSIYKKAYCTANLSTNFESKLFGYFGVCQVIYKPGFDGKRHMNKVTTFYGT